MPRDLATPLPQPVFNEGNITPDPTRFKVSHPSDTQQYKAIQNLLKKDTVGFETSRMAPDALFTLQDAYGPHGPEIISRIKAAKQLVFHAAGDTGASNEGKYGNERSVADQVTQDCRTADAASRAMFFFHLGDVVYDFGEAKYYYDQFYDPYRNYPGPIFAIPGNHDSFVIPNTPVGSAPLDTFVRNFCATTPTITPEAASLHRTAMTQPGVYFTLDAPFVRIIGLFSNALEDPGVISSEKGRWPGVPDVQLDFLAAQLARIKKEKYAGAVLLAMHHPPFSYAPPPKTPGTGGNHSGSPNMLAQIDTLCSQAGVYPHAVLSGHAHNYQRYSRIFTFGGKDIEVPFIVCGDAGHNVNTMVKARRGAPPQEPNFDTDVTYMESKTAAVKAKQLILKHYDDTNYGYLRITVDQSSLGIGFHQVGQSVPQSRVDMVTVDLKSHQVVGN
ncbi:MAG: metallophosphoesterase [Acidobacteria bacterium]|nr:metallophosphoesterase [Acidobacteriota bacterium]